MPGRYTGVVGKSFSGDRDKARSRQGAAQVLVQSLVDRIKNSPMKGRGLLTGKKYLADGSTVWAMVNMIGIVPIVRTWVDAPVGDGVVAGTYLPVEEGFIFDPHSNDVDEKDLFFGISGLIGERESTIKYKLEPDTKRKAGFVSGYGYFSGKPVILSWDTRMRSRYLIDLGMTNYDIMMAETDDNYPLPNCGYGGIPNIYIGGHTINTPFGVTGAGIFNNTLVYVDHKFYNTGDYETLYGVATFYKSSNALAQLDNAGVFSGQSGTFLELTVSWEEIGSFTIGWRFMAPWFFHPEGHTATTVLGNFVRDYSMGSVDATLTKNDDGDIFVDFTHVPFTHVTIKDEVTPYESIVANPSTTTYNFSDWQAIVQSVFLEEDHWTSPGGVIGAAAIVAGIARERWENAGFTVEDLDYAGYFQNSLDIFETDQYKYATSCSLGGTDTIRVYNGYQDFTSGHVGAACVRDMNNAHTTEYHLSNEFRYKAVGKYLIAVDYGFDGTRLEVTFEYSSNERVKTNSSQFEGDNSYVRIEPNTYPIVGGWIGHTKTDQWVQKELTAFDAVGKLCVNGTPLITVSGHMDALSWRRDFGVETVDGETVSSYRDFTGSPDASADTERVIITDMDARTNTCIYARTTVSLKYRVDDIQELLVIPVGDAIHTPSYVVKHQGTTKTYTPDSPFVLSDRPALYWAEAASWMMPRITSASDGFENFGLRYLYDFVGSDNYYPAYRWPGKLCVRSNTASAISDSDASNRGIDSIEGRPLRPVTHINEIVISNQDGIPIERIDPVSSIESAISTTLGDTPMLFTIRAV